MIGQFIQCEPTISNPDTGGELKSIEVVYNPIALAQSSGLTSEEMRAYEGTLANQNIIRRTLKIPKRAEIRLKHGLFLTVDLETKQLKFTEANYAAMLESKDTEVVTFRNAYQANLTALAADNKPGFEIIG